MRTKGRQLSLRMPGDVLAELEEYLQRSGLSLSAALTQGMKEWLRVQRHSGIDFRWTPTGRKAHVTGTGLAIWELHNMWLDHGRNVEKLRENYPGLSKTQIAAAVKYAQEYPDEAPSGWGPRPKGMPVVRV